MRVCLVYALCGGWDCKKAKVMCIGFLSRTFQKVEVWSSGQSNDQEVFILIRGL